MESKRNNGNSRVLLSRERRRPVPRGLGPPGRVRARPEAPGRGNDVAVGAPEAGVDVAAPGRPEQERRGPSQVVLASAAASRSPWATFAKSGAPRHAVWCFA